MAALPLAKSTPFRFIVTISHEGTATQVLAETVRANGSVEEVARWYEISPQSVQQAVDYEQSLAA